MEIGRKARDFSLRNQHGERVTLTQFAGSKSVVLVFYPLAFSGVCTRELIELQGGLADFANDTTELLAISCDHMYSLRAYAERDGYHFSLLSDFWPHGGVSSAYGVFDDSRGHATRSTIIVDGDGIVRWQVDNEISAARSLDDYRKVLNGLQ